jgi:hypothetical protein
MVCCICNQDGCVRTIVQDKLIQVECKTCCLNPFFITEELEEILSTKSDEEKEVFKFYISTEYYHIFLNNHDYDVRAIKQFDFYEKTISNKRTIHEQINLLLEFLYQDLYKITYYNIKDSRLIYQLGVYLNSLEGTEKGLMRRLTASKRHKLSLRIAYTRHQVYAFFPCYSST